MFPEPSLEKTGRKDETISVLHLWNTGEFEAEAIGHGGDVEKQLSDISAALSVSKQISFSEKACHKSDTEMVVLPCFQCIF
jgi:hypothetical protein